MVICIHRSTIVQRRSHDQCTMKTAETLAELLEAQCYTFNELRWCLAKYRGKSLPPSTLRDWLTICRIKPNAHGMYEPEDLRLLVRYCFWLKRGGTSKGFRTIHKQEMKQDAS